MIMDFQDFLQIVPHFLESSLPGEESHNLMVPKERLDQMKSINMQEIDPKKAAVMMLLYPKETKTHLVLIVRNSYKGVHSSQIAFPGGKYETTDIDFEQTALRETFEEIGVQPSKIRVIKPFTQIYIPPSNFMVYPYLGICSEELLFYPDDTEVAGIIELPLSVFLSDEIVINVKMKTSYSNEIDVPAFEIEDKIVWGATAMMLSELKTAVKEILVKTAKG
jgi:8-oxo-dGTP pyrophosphatase MutT (NUDIX family)